MMLLVEVVGEKLLFAFWVLVYQMSLSGCVFKMCRRSYCSSPDSPTGSDKQVQARNSTFFHDFNRFSLCLAD